VCKIDKNKYLCLINNHFINSNMPRLFTTFIVALGLIATTYTAQAQQITSSNLTIVIINTDFAATIPDEPAVGASMVIVSRPQPQRNFVADQFTPALLNYSGRIGIQVRGTTSQFIDKKPYNFETRYGNGSNLDTSLLGMPSENDWILLNVAYDPTYMHDFLAYGYARNTGNWAARGVYCELIINGDYRGLYILQEKIKKDKDRVDISDLTNQQNSAPSYSGGYITKADKTTGGDPVAFNMPSYTGSTDFIHHYPAPTAITTQQNAYITGQFNSLQAKANNPSITAGYPSVIDVRSFVDYMLVAELCSGVDAYQYSTYFHKDRNDKLKAGPVWDFNLGFGLDFGAPYAAWQFDNGDNTGAKFWKDLYTQSNFKCAMAQRWAALRQPGQPFYQPSMVTYIDSIKTYITEGVQHDFARWGSGSNTFTGDVFFLKQFVNNKITWMDAQLTTLGCTTPTLPSLVINEIMYHAPDVATTDGDNYDYIELKNAGTTPIALAGIHFKGGVVYQFAPNATLPAGGIIVLASNATDYQSKYGVGAPFGVYSREVSNDSENIVLADAMGNTIDEVFFDDNAPFPIDADGTGRSIELKSTTMDNNNGANWATHPALGGTPNAENNIIISTTEVAPRANISLQIQPNPNSGNFEYNLTTTTTQTIHLALYNALGQQIWADSRFFNQGFHQNAFAQKIPKGIYTLRAQTTDYYTTQQKIVVQ
jgi:hypothetical protein